MFIKGFILALCGAIASAVQAATFKTTAPALKPVAPMLRLEIPAAGLMPSVMAMAAGDPVGPKDDQSKALPQLESAGSSPGGGGDDDPDRAEWARNAAAGFFDGAGPGGPGDDPPSQLPTAPKSKEDLIVRLMEVGLTDQIAVRLGREVVDYLVAEGIEEEEVVASIPDYNPRNRVSYGWSHDRAAFANLSRHFSSIAATRPDDLSKEIAFLRKAVRFHNITRRGIWEFGEHRLVTQWSYYHRETLGQDGMDLYAARLHWDEMLKARAEAHQAIRDTKLVQGARHEDFLSRLDDTVYLYGRAGIDDLHAWRSVLATVKSDSLRHLQAYIGWLPLTLARIEMDIVRDAARREFANIYTPASIDRWFEDQYRFHTRVRSTWKEIRAAIDSDPYMIKR